MTVRKWKLQGNVHWPSTITIKIDDRVIADKIDAESTFYKDQEFIAEGSFDFGYSDNTSLADSVDTKHSIEIEVHEGSISIGPIWWNYAYVPALLDPLAERYKFAHPAMPDDSDAALPPPYSEEWGSKKSDAYSWYSGKGTILPKESSLKDKDPRVNVKVNGNNYTLPGILTLIPAHVGTVLSFDFGIPSRY